MPVIYNALIDALSAIVGALCALIATHPLATLLFIVCGTISYWMFSAIVSGLPTPEEIWPKGDGRNYLIYKFVFKASHSLAGSIGRFVEWARLRWGVSKGTEAAIEVAADKKVNEMK